ncbi:MAG: P1 family peptidase [Ottowia sp.]
MTATNHTLTAVRGIQVGHHTSARRPTGCTVILAQAPDGRGAMGGVDVRGAAPGTRETYLLSPVNSVDQVHAVLLAGGSAWGLDATAGVMRWLEEHDIGLRLGDQRGQLVPIVPAAVLMDLHLGDARIRPGADAGYAACAAASDEAVRQGSIGAGAGATVGKLFGPGCAMKGGLGSASVSLGEVTVGALVAVNALGDVVDPGTGQPIAGARRDDGKGLRNSTQSALAGDEPWNLLVGSNTTIGVIATDAPLSKARATRLAGAGHDGLARAIRPVHTISDGDTLFALATGHAPALDFNVLCIMAAEAAAQACVAAVRAANTLRLGNLVLPAASDFLGRSDAQQDQAHDG